MNEVMILISSILVPLITDVANFNIKNSKIRYIVFLVVAIIFGTGVFFLQKNGNLLNDVSAIAVLSTSIFHLFYGDSKVRKNLKKLMK